MALDFLTVPRLGSHGIRALVFPTMPKLGSFMTPKFWFSINAQAGLLHGIQNLHFSDNAQPGWLHDIQNLDFSDSAQTGLLPGIQTLIFLTVPRLGSFLASKF